MPSFMYLKDGKWYNHSRHCKLCNGLNAKAKCICNIEDEEKEVEYEDYDVKCENIKDYNITTKKTFIRKLKLKVQQ